MNRQEQLQQDLAEHDAKFKCEHEQSELRKRILSNDTIQYINQCLNCGKSVGRAVKKNEVIALNNGIEPQLFNVEILKQWKNNKDADHKRIISGDRSRADEKQAVFWEWYNEYMESDEWKIKREKVLKRANYVCEGCIENAATQVHHLTYRHKGNEYLFELVAVCDNCHETLHNEDLAKDYHVFLREVIY